MSFFVSPDAVDGLSGLVLRNSTGLTDYHTVITRTAPKGFDEGALLDIIAPKLDQMQRQADRDTAKAAALLTMSGDELSSAAVRYAGLDARQRAAIDAQYPYHGEAARRMDYSEVTEPEKAAEFEDVAPLYRDPRNPDRTLGVGGYPDPEPTEYDAAGEGWNVDLEAAASRLSGAVSIAGQFRGLLQQILGFDPIEVLARLTAGDWRPVLRHGMAIEGLNQIGSWVAANVDRGRYGIQDLWGGNAATAAGAWLEQYSAAVRVLAAWGQQAGERLQAFARTAYHVFMTINNYVNLLIDTLVDLATAGGAGAVVALVGGWAPAASAKNIPELLTAIGSVAAGWARISVLIDWITVKAHEFAGTSSNYVAGSQAVTAPPWPPELRAFDRPEF